MLIREKKRKKSEYHGRGPDGYKEGPMHGMRTNLDFAKDAADVADRAGNPGELCAKRRLQD